MSTRQFQKILSLSNTEIYAAIAGAEIELFNLRFKKATRQNLKSHEIKKIKRQVARLKTLLTVRSEN
jgi:large subunit ribosomal protein L29